MSKRSLRRSTERRARKLARQSQPQTETSATTMPPFESEPPATTAPPTPTPETAAVIEQQPPQQAQPASEPAPETHRTLPLTEARLEANRRNSQLSTGPASTLGLAASSQNRTAHGLARHVNGTFTLLPSEDPAAFASFKQSLLSEHQPTTETENVLVTGMVEAHWLADRSQHLIETTCMHRETGDITDRQKFSLFLRYKTTHTRAFHKCLNDLAKLRSERKKEQSGFEAQKIKNEKHEMKKDLHHYEVLMKDFDAHFSACRYTSEMLAAKSKSAEFGAKFREELTKRGVPLSSNDEILTAAA